MFNTVPPQLMVSKKRPSSLSPLTRSCTVRGANREEYVLPSHYHPISPMFAHLDYLLTITAGSLKI